MPLSVWYRPIYYLASVTDKLHPTKLIQLYVMEDKHIFIKLENRQGEKIDSIFIDLSKDTGISNYVIHQKVMMNTKLLRKELLVQILFTRELS